MTSRSDKNKPNFLFVAKLFSFNQQGQDEREFVSAHSHQVEPLMKNFGDFSFGNVFDFSDKIRQRVKFIGHVIKLLKQVSESCRDLDGDTFSLEVPPKTVAIRSQ